MIALIDAGSTDRSASDLTRLDLCFAQGLQGKMFFYDFSVAVNSMSVTMSTFVFLREQQPTKEWSFHCCSPEKKMVKVREGNFAKETVEE